MKLDQFFRKTAKSDREEADQFYRALEQAGLPFERSNQLETAVLNWVNKAALSGAKVARKARR